MSYATDKEVTLAEDLGYEWCKNVSRGHRFAKGNREIWSVCINEQSLQFGWQTADLVNGSYCNHLKFPELSDALARPLMTDGIQS